MASGQTNKKTILAIFSHPDDENVIGQVLAKYARLGHDVMVIIATDGKYFTISKNITLGDSLGLLRREETICACKKLNINPPIYLGIDRLDTKNGVRAYLNGHTKALDDIKRYVEQFTPDVILTWGPDGEYGHSEHIVTGAIVTELLLKEAWVDKYPLYFPVDIREDVENDPDHSYINPEYINLKVVYSDEDEQKMIEASKCYVTQHTKEEMIELAEMVKKDKTNTKYFRKFVVSTKMNKEFWD